MGLREDAAADLQAILEDRTTGFGWDITVTNPAGTSLAVVGFSQDIGLSVDPETGIAISARRATVTLRLAALAALGVPVGVSDETTKPWLVAFADINGGAHTFKVTEAMPDRAIGTVVCFLEAYKTA